MDCGPACLRIIAKYYGKSYPLQVIRDKTHLTKKGVSMLGIEDAAKAIGMHTEGVKITWEQLNDISLPCIIHWRRKHFVVLYDIKKSRNPKFQDEIQISDPACGLLKYKRDEFLKHWLSSDDKKHGFALTVEPSKKFYSISSEKKTPLSFINVLFYLKPYQKYIFHLILAMLLGSIISIIFPFLTQAVVDIGINGKNINIIVSLLIAQIMLSLGQMGNELVRSWLMLHITSRVSITFISDFLNKLMRLPISFFDVRMIGDIMQRIGDNNRIQSFLTGSLISIFISVITFIVYAIVMAGYNLQILLVFIVGSILYVVWVLKFLKKRRILDYKKFQESSSNQSNLVQIVTGMQEIKLNNCEKKKRWEWEQIQVKLFHINIKSLALGQYQQVGGVFLNQIKNIIISFMAAKSVVDNNLTLGMMMAMQYILGQLNAPLSQFISFVQSAQDAKISLERLGEIYDREDEEPVGTHKIQEIPKKTSIILKNVTFQYEGPNSEKVLNRINLTIPAGKITAVVGTSGSGKTTLLKLILGFYKPTNGEILLNNKALHLYSDSKWRKECGVVMQEGYIFSDSIANNIAVGDSSPDITKLKYASMVSNINDYISLLPLGYNTKIGSEGSGLSTGQKQRILIARAVYKNPNYLFLDEATNALDATNERKIIANLNEFFTEKTVVIVAHRLSTVMNADIIVVLEGGTIVETGTHTDLVAKKGKYYSLIKDQLELGK
jgi:ATP-binding cassette subfamily B protein